MANQNSISVICRNPWQITHTTTWRKRSHFTFLFGKLFINVNFIISLHSFSLNCFKTFMIVRHCQKPTSRIGQNALTPSLIFFPAFIMTTHLLCLKHNKFLESHTSISVLYLQLPSSGIRQN